MTGELELKRGSVKAPHVLFVHCCLRSPSSFLASMVDSRVKAPMHVSVNIPPDQLDAIERARDGDDLALSFKVQGVLFRPDDHEPTPEEPMRHGFTDDLFFRVKAAEWVEVLQQLQYAEGFLVQVPKCASRETPKALLAAVELKKRREGTGRRAIRGGGRAMPQCSRKSRTGGGVTQAPRALGYAALTGESDRSAVKSASGWPEARPLGSNKRGEASRILLARRSHGSGATRRRQSPSRRRCFSKTRPADGARQRADPVHR